MPADRLFKVLDEHGRSCHGGFLQWSMPKDDQPGEWMPNIVGPLVPCQRGYHVVTLAQLPQWLGPALYEVEVRSERIDQDDKIVVSQARIVARVTTWTERTARLFAADCAEHALKAEQGVGREPDARSWAAVQAARDYAEGRLSDKARIAARSAAWSAACAAESAARIAARSAARNAAWSAAENGERAWQTDRLFTAYLLTGAP